MKPTLALVNAETGEVAPDAPSYAVLQQRLIAAEELNLGQEATIKSQAAAIGRLKRQIEQDDPAHHPQSKDISDLIDHWKEATGHPRAKLSKDRFDVVKARLKDGYSFEQLRLAIDGIAAFPYVVNGQRVAAGKPSQRHDALSLALKGGENLERFANLGALARKDADT